VRHGTQTLEASYSRLQDLLQRHIAAVVPDGNVSDLTTQLAQLHALYVARQRANHPASWTGEESTGNESIGTAVPDADLAGYLTESIERKQAAIADLLRV
jgi:hypothetical protein